MKKNHKRMFLWLLLICLCFGLASCSVLSAPLPSGTLWTQEETVTISKSDYDRLIQYEELDELMQIIEQFYYEEVDTQALLDGANMGLVYGLDDVYSYYYTPEDYAAMWEDDEGEYAGIGIQLMADYLTGICTITRVFTDSPALDAGLQKGDILIKVEDFAVSATTMQEAVNVMRGTTGEPVTIEILRDDELLTFVVNREIIHTNWVSSTVLEDNVGYIILYEFSGDCDQAFQTALDDLLAQGITSLIIDLRDNPGGWVESTLNIADLFLPATVITTLEYRDGSSEIFSTSDDDALDIPLVIMVNGNSASSSEIMAGSFQDLERATIVGTQTYGKGVAQFVLPIGSRGAGVQLTAAQYFTPNGNSVHEIGITPDIIAQLPEDDNTMYDVGDMSDEQLQVAHEVAVSLVE